MAQKIFLLLSLWFLILQTPLQAQQEEVLLNAQDRQGVEAVLVEKDTFHHTGFRPFVGKGLDTIQEYRPPNTEGKSWFLRKLRSESFLILDKADFELAVDPILHFQYGMDLQDTSTYADTTTFYKNTRGFLIRGRIGETVSFSTSFRENQAFFPSYLREYVEKRQVVPGQGRVKPFRETGFDYARASGQVSFSPLDRFNVRLGHGKQFIGEGYRSLLLSDNSFNRPYLQFTTGSFQDRIRYTNIITSMQSLDRQPKGDTPEALFKGKAGSFHHLSLSLHPKVRWGLFEGVIWERWKDSNGTQPLDYSIFNPVIFMNTAIQGFSSNDNALVGTELKVGPFAGIAAYGQFMLDDPSKGKYGWQAGIKAYDFPFEGLMIQAEYNDIQPYAYAHSKVLQNYGHYAQPLAHPMGAGIEEWVGILKYRYKALYLKLKGVYAQYPDNGSGAGKDIFMSDEAVVIKLADQPYELFYQDVELGYTVNPQNNLNIMVGWSGRDFDPGYGNPEKNGFLYFGLRTNFSNYYYDL